jgi:hypothetical protein
VTIITPSQNHNKHIASPHSTREDVCRAPSSSLPPPNLPKPPASLLLPSQRRRCLPYPTLPAVLCSHPPSMGLPEPLKMRPNMSRDTGVLSTCGGGGGGGVWCGCVWGGGGRGWQQQPGHSGGLDEKRALLHACGFLLLVDSGGTKARAPNRVVAVQGLLLLLLCCSDAGPNMGASVVLHEQGGVRQAGGCMPQLQQAAPTAVRLWATLHIAGPAVLCGWFATAVNCESGERRGTGEWGEERDWGVGRGGEGLGSGERRRGTGDCRPRMNGGKGEGLQHRLWRGPLGGDLGGRVPP